MRRALLFLLFASAGTAALFRLSGGAAGPNAERPAPVVSVEPLAATPRDGIKPPIDLGLSVEAGRNLAVQAPPEPLRFVDPASGQDVLIPDFVRWTLEVGDFLPSPAPGKGRQAAVARNARILSYREPRTLTEARAVAEGLPGAMEALLKWRTTAQEMEADFLDDELHVQAPEARRFARETVIRLSHGVLIHDVEEDLVVEGDDAEIQPYLEVVRGVGRFDVRHEAFELTGEGLKLERGKREDRLEIARQAEVHVYEAPPGPDGRPLFDVGPEALEPTTLRAEGGALMVRERPTGAVTETLRLRVQVRVHAGQTDGRSLDAERVDLVATRAPAARGGTRRDRWRVQEVDAQGRVRVEYPGRTDDGGPFLLSLAAERLRHERQGGDVAVLLLEGRPEVTLRGEVPVEGMARGTEAGVIHASCRDHARLLPADPADLPPGADVRRYRRLVLEGEARIRRVVPGSPDEDVLRGDRMSLLLTQRHDGDPAEGNRAAGSGLLAVSFAVAGDVEIGGTRLTGHTQRLVGSGLDTDTPLLYAEGPATTLVFHDIARGERMLGGDRPAGRGPAGSAGAAAPEDAWAWVLERLAAGDGVVVETRTGGPTVGIAARLEGDLIGYERVSDLARLQGSGARPATIAFETAPGMRQVLDAPTVVLDRNDGIVTAEGGVRGRFVLSRERDAGLGAGLGGLGEADAAPPTRLRVVTDGRVEIRPRLAGSSFRPRRETEQVVRVEGGVVAELEAANRVVDSLRAAYLEVALVLARAADDGTPTAPLARVGGRTGPTTARPRRSESPEAMPWDFSAQTLRAHVAADGFRVVEAFGDVALDGAPGRLRGRSLTYGSRERTLEIHGDARAPAEATFGPADALNEVRAAELSLRLGDDGPARLAARGPAAAILVRRIAAAPGALERYTLACRGDVTVTPTSLVAVGEPVLHRQRRPAAGAPWSTPASLWTNEVRLEGTNLLSERGADVRNVVASGPRTTFQAGERGRRTRVWGDRFELDAAAGTATLTGAPGRDLRVRYGPEDAPTYDLEQTRVVVDLETGLIRDWDQFRVILRGAGR